MPVETSKTLALLCLRSSLRSAVSELSEQGTKTVILPMLKMHKGHGKEQDKAAKACDENVLRMKEFRLNFAPAEEIQTSTSNLQWEHSSYLQIGYFTVLARDTFYISN